MNYICNNLTLTFINDQVIYISWILFVCDRQAKAAKSFFKAKVFLHYHYSIWLMLLTY